MTDDALIRCAVALVIAVVALVILLPIAFSGPPFPLCGRCKDPMPDGYWCRTGTFGPICGKCGHECGFPHEFDKLSHRPPEVL